MQRFLGIVLLCLVAVGALAFYMNWVHFSTASALDRSKTDLTVTVNKDKVKKDVAKAESQLEQLGKKVHAAIESKSFLGSIQTVSADGNHLTIRHQDGKQEIAVDLTPDTRIRRGDREATRNDLRPSARVLVTYETRDTRNIAESVTIEPK